MISDETAARVTVRRGKNFNVAIFSDTINVINDKICMIVLLIELYLSIPITLILTIFQGHWGVKEF